MYMALENCFYTGAGDLCLDGSVNGFMGNTDVGAGNCFTKNTIPDVNAVSNIFEYYVDLEDAGLCYDPITNSSYSQLIADDRSDLECGSTNPVSPNVKWNYCYPNKKLTCIEIDYYITQVTNEITATTNNITFTSSNKNNILKYLRSCKARLLKLRLFNCRPEQTPFPQEPEIDNSTMLKDKADKVAMYISKREYNIASDLLSNFTDITEEGIDFVWVQQLNIQRLMQGSSFVLTNSNKNSLLNIANKNQPLTGYARGLYYILTGDIIMPTITRHSSEPRSRIDNTNDDNIFPNPFTDYLDLSEFNQKASSIDIFDSYGRNIYDTNNIPERINTNEWRNGIYFIRMKLIDESIKIFKLVK